MKSTFLKTCKPVVLGLAIALAGCSEISQGRLAGIQRGPGSAEGPPKTEATLAISNPPTAPARGTQEETIRPASFVPDSTPRAAAPTEAPAVPPAVALRALHQRAAERVATMNAYVFRLRRREAVDGKKMPEELIQVAVRHEPFSVHLKWIGAEAKGRETIYVRGKFNDEMQILLASGDIFPLSPAGIRWSIPTDDPTARSRSRYPITDTGLGPLVSRFGKIVQGIERGDAREGSMKYLGPVKRAEFSAPVEAAVQTLPPKCDPNLPKGGQRWWYFDATTGLPVLIVTHDPTGEVEYYCHEQIEPARLTEDYFDPDRLWKKR